MADEVPVAVPDDDAAGLADVGPAADLVLAPVAADGLVVPHLLAPDVEPAGHVAGASRHVEGVRTALGPRRRQARLALPARPVGGQAAVFWTPRVVAVEGSARDTGGGIRDRRAGDGIRGRAGGLRRPGPALRQGLLAPERAWLLSAGVLRGGGSRWGARCGRALAGIGLVGTERPARNARGRVRGLGRRVRGRRRGRRGRPSRAVVLRAWRTRGGRGLGPFGRIRLRPFAVRPLYGRLPLAAPVGTLGRRPVLVRLPRAGARIRTGLPGGRPLAVGAALGRRVGGVAGVGTGLLPGGGRLGLLRGLPVPGGGLLRGIGLTLALLRPLALGFRGRPLAGGRGGLRRRLRRALGLLRALRGTLALGGRVGLGPLAGRGRLLARRLLLGPLLPFRALLPVGTVWPLGTLLLRLARLLPPRSALRRPAPGATLVRCPLPHLDAQPHLGGRRMRQRRRYGRQERAGQQ